MTLIVSFSVDNFPILMGDALLSVTEETKRHLKLANSANFPMRGNFTFSNEIGGLPISFCQKICILDEHLAAAWCGDQALARRILESMYQYAKDQPINLTTLSAWSAQWASCTEEIQIIIMLYEEGDGLWVLGGHEIDMEHWGLGNVRYAGTGSGMLLPILTNENLAGGHNSPNIISGVAESYVKAITYGLALSGTFLSYEISQHPTNFFSYFFGGAYETCFFDGSKFTKIDDILYIFFSATIHNEEHIEMVWTPILFKSNYVGEDLIITVVEGTPNEKPGYNLSRFHTYKIQPLVRTRLPSNEFKQDFSYTHLVCVVGFERAGEHYSMASTFINKAEFSVQPSEDLTELKVSFSHNFLKTLFECLKNHMKS